MSIQHCQWEIRVDDPRIDFRLSRDATDYPREAKGVNKLARLLARSLALARWN